MAENKPNLLQKQTPSNQWLVKDDNKKIIRAKSLNIPNPEKLSLEDVDVMQKLIDFVRFSQKPELNKENGSDYLRPAVGLAAPQIGVNKNMFYIRIEYPHYNEKEELEKIEVEEYAMVNPKIIAKSEQICALEGGEGCLSVDQDHKGIVSRAYKILVEGYDFLLQKWLKLTLRGYPAIVWQHEMDHNNGHLYYDLINKNNPEFKKEDWILI